MSEAGARLWQQSDKKAAKRLVTDGKSQVSYPTHHVLLDP